MLPVLWITSLVSVLLVQPWSVNILSEHIELNPKPIDPVDLEFLEYENEYLRVWKDTILCVLCFLLILVARIQWKWLLAEKNDLEILFKKSDGLPVSSQDISKFFSDTEHMFNELEKRIGILNKRFKKLEKDVDWDDKVYVKQNDEIKFLTESWNGQYATFGLVDIDPEAGANDWVTRMELFDVQEKFDADMCEMEGWIEDMGLLEH